VNGLAPGTKVTALEQTDSVSGVTDGQYQFKVPSSHLTNDLDIAKSVGLDFTKSIPNSPVTLNRLL